MLARLTDLLDTSGDVFKYANEISQLRHHGDSFCKHRHNITQHIRDYRILTTATDYRDLHYRPRITEDLQYRRFTLQTTDYIIFTLHTTDYRILYYGPTTVYRRFTLKTTDYRDLHYRQRITEDLQYRRFTLQTTDYRKFTLKTTDYRILY